MVATKRQALAHVLVCSGCCCGRTEKGKPPIPLDWLKTNWKQRGLLRSVQLTISGCLGPCDLTNVVAILTPQAQIWLGGISDQAEYELLLEWATASAQANEVLPLPQRLLAKRFQRYARKDPAAAAL